MDIIRAVFEDSMDFKKRLYYLFNQFLCILGFHDWKTVETQCLQTLRYQLQCEIEDKSPLGIGFRGGDRVRHKVCLRCGYEENQIKDAKRKFYTEYYKEKERDSLAHNLIETKKEDDQEFLIAYKEVEKELEK